MIRSTLKKSAVGIAALAAVAAIAPTGASASTVSLSSGTLSYSAAPGQTNDLKVLMTAGVIQFVENNSDQVTSAAPGCLRYDWGTQCSLNAVNFVRVYASDMHDRVIATIEGTKAFTMLGGDGNDLLDVTGNTPNRAFIHGEGGDDRLYGRQFGDTVYGGLGNDLIQTGGGVDSIIGGPGADNIDAGSDNDFVYAKDGTRDTVNCSTGDADWVQYDRTWWGGSLDSLTSCERRSS